MANHGYVIKCKKRYDMDKIGELAQKFVDERLKGVFKLTRGEDLWVITLPGDEMDGIQFWVGYWYENSRRIKAIEIRHGHGSHLWWWADFYLTNYLATELEGKVTDDGDGVVNEPDLSKYENLDKFRQSGKCWWDSGMTGEFKMYPALLVFTKHPKPYAGSIKLLKQGRELAKKMGFKY